MINTRCRMLSGLRQMPSHRVGAHTFANVLIDGGETSMSSLGGVDTVS